jgi:hypothetical protein
MMVMGTKFETSSIFTWPGEFFIVEQKIDLFLVAA